MSYLDKYKRNNNSLDGSIKGEREEDFKLSVSSAFMDSPSYFEVLINNKDTFVKSHIVDDSETKEQKIIVTLDHQIKNGDVVDWQQDKYINILTDNMANTYYRGTLRLCCGQLKWVDDEGEINKRYFTFKSDPATNFGTDNGNIIVLGSERRTLLVSFDEDTTSFRKDDRFIFDSRAWKITALDNISIKGISIVTVQEDLINPAKDNQELEIADYYDNVADYKIQILNGSFVTINEDQTLQLNVNVTNRSIPVTSPVIEYTLSCTNVASVDSNGLIKPIKTGSVFVTASFKSAVAQIEISITESTSYSYTCEIIGADDIKVSRTQTYTAKFYRNGIEYPDESKFSLTADDGVSITNLATIGTQDNVNNSCKVVASQTLGYVRLHLSNANGLSTTNKRIKIRPLF
ncbi:hypothetical protein [Paenibacillus sp. FSL H3-0286]|uniref:hypothetical protein n=1 Tax=Paenibacillus sp. FSL H3-0286 TaxID=2921427 RepID=UPI00324F280E